MKCVAAPMVGGLATSFALELLVHAVVLTIWKWPWGVKRRLRARGFRD
jgi:Cu/Ag efflux pump CusA